MEERTKRITLRPNEFSEILKLRESKKTIKDYYNKSGNYQVWLTEREQRFIEDFRDEVMRKKLSSKPKDKQLTKLEEENDNLKELLDLKDSLSNIEIYKLVPKEGDNCDSATAIPLLSDIHIDEKVLSDGVMGLNSFDSKIGKQRLDNYFTNLTKLIKHHQKNYNLNNVVFGFLGDFITGYLHQENEQTNTMTPLEAIAYLKPILMSGLKHFREQLPTEKVTIVCVCGNHGRNTKKIQHSNFTQTNFEYFLYKDIAQSCEDLNLGFDFIIPKCSSAIIEIYGERYLFAHGHQFKYRGGIGGIYVPLSVWFAKSAMTLKIKRAFIGHWHTSVSIKEAVVNGSVVGYNAHAMSSFLPFEKPQQSLTIITEKYGTTNQQSIYLD